MSWGEEGGGAEERRGERGERGRREEMCSGKGGEEVESKA